MRADAVTSGGAAAGVTPIFVRQSADQVDLAVSSVLNVTGMTATLAVGTYAFRLVVRYKASSAKDMTLRWNPVPAGTTYMATTCGPGVDVAASGTTADARVVNAAGNWHYFGGNDDAAGQPATINGIFVITTAGSVQLQYAGSLGGGDLTFFANSFMEFWKVA